MQAASLSTKTVFDMEKNAIVRSRLQLVEKTSKELHIPGGSLIPGRVQFRPDRVQAIRNRLHRVRV